MSFTSLLSGSARRAVLLIGSGPLAAATMRRLVEAGARVRWFASDFDLAEEIWLSGRPNRIELAFREPRTTDFTEAAAAIVVTGEPLARRVSEQARAAGCPVSVLGRPDLSTLDLDAECDEGSDQAGGPGSPPPSPLARLRERLSVYLSGATMNLRAARPRSLRT